MVSRILGLIFSVFLVGGIICTVSRKGMATGIIAFFIYWYLKRKYKEIIVLGIFVVILGFILSGYAIISGRFSKETLDKQFTGKCAMTYAGWQMYKESPLIGLGYEGYNDNFGRYFPWSDKDKYDAHNIFITALTNYGLIGFIPFLCIFLYPISAARKTLKEGNSNISDSTSKDLAIICISSVIPFMLSGWFAGGLFYTPAVIILLYANISLFLSSIKT
jgi:O-antigen ligase